MDEYQALSHTTPVLRRCHVPASARITAFVCAADKPSNQARPLPTHGRPGRAVRRCFAPCARSLFLYAALCSESSSSCFRAGGRLPRLHGTGSRQ